MKKLLIVMMMCLPLGLMAQNTWEMPAQAEGNPDQKYLVGAVPVVDGKVTFQTTIEAPGKNAEQVADMYSRMSPGWQSRARQMDSMVEIRMALAFPHLRMDRLAGVIPTFSASSPEDIFRRASMTSILMMMGITYFTSSFSSCTSGFWAPLR